MPAVFARDNLVAWCIVPFDGKKRGPAERAAMCAELGLTKVAYDWRQEHVATFEQEILEYRKHGLEYFAFWDVHDEAFRLFRKYNLHPQIWKMIAAPQGDTQSARVSEAVRQLLPLVERTRTMGSELGLYNHGGWAGEPENMVAVCRSLREKHNAGHVGIVYNMHHAHGHVDDFAEVLELVTPYLLCLNLNGMTRNGDQRDRKILPLGEGELDVSLLKTIQASGYHGPVGIIGHTQDDVAQRLQDNLDGLDWILPQVAGKPAGPKPTPRTWSPTVDTPHTEHVSATHLKGSNAYRLPPLTVECRVTLNRRDAYNILVASDTKQSGAHWEIFSMNGSGMLTAYTPGLKPDHTRSTAMICDGKPHNIAMTLTASLVQLFVDGKVVARQKVESAERAAIPGGLAIAGLVEGGLGCSGPIAWVRISQGVRQPVATSATAPQRDSATRLLWTPPANKKEPTRLTTDGKTPQYSPDLIASLVKQAATSGSAGRGLTAFSNAKSACLSCHRLGKHGGTAGPDLTRIGKERKPEEIVESILWPKRTVKPEYKAHQIVTDDGRSQRGYILQESRTSLVLRDPTLGPRHSVTIPTKNIELRSEVGTLMPDNLAATLAPGQLVDVLRLLIHQGRADGIPPSDLDSVLHHTMAHRHGPAAFPFDHRPLLPEHWPGWQHPVNRDRIYDFYSKQADYFRRQADSGTPVPPVLTGFPGLDGGEQGHWGNQNEQTWASNQWNTSDRGTLMCGVFRGAGKTIPRGFCVRLGDNGELACCFNPDTLAYEVVWKGGFVKTSAVRHGFIEGLQMDGQPVKFTPRPGPDQPIRYQGLYRIGRRVIFAYRVGNTEWLDSPWVSDGAFTQTAGPRDSHPMRDLVNDPAQLISQWPQAIRVPIQSGTGSPYAVDTFELPVNNPWQALFFATGQGFLPDGSALICTMQGDVWKISDIAYPSGQATWRRFASGLHHPLGMVVDSDGIFVVGRDQITRLHDQNDDGEADEYECFSNAYQTSPAGHDYICGLVRDQDGYFYTASGNQGIVRISPDGRQAEVIATGFRNPDGIGLTADGRITVPCSEGEWTPASMICELDPHPTGSSTPFFGHRGPQNGQVPELPLAYLPRGLDNSAGGQVCVTSERWGPLQDQLLHLSFGTGSHFLVLRDSIAGQAQGAIVPLPGEFSSGIHRGQFNPHDGQLYVTGMQGWGSYTPQTGCFQRVRYTGAPVVLPVGFKVYRNGLLLNFSARLNRASVENSAHHFAQCWNYRYSQAYGSPEFSTRHAGMRGHDSLAIQSAHLTESGRDLFLEIQDLQPVNQLHLRLQT
ncbi:MAG: DUF6797 domain-containing protein, partial [Planctomycetaceae bacterium]